MDFDDNENDTNSEPQNVPLEEVQEVDEEYILSTKRAARDQKTISNSMDQSPIKTGNFHQN